MNALSADPNQWLARNAPEAKVCGCCNHVNPPEEVGKGAVHPIIRSRMSGPIISSSQKQNLHKRQNQPSAKDTSTKGKKKKKETMVVFIFGGEDPGSYYHSPSISLLSSLDQTIVGHGLSDLPSAHQHNNLLLLSSIQLVFARVLGMKLPQCCTAQPNLNIKSL